jgi:hypothetical protein
MIKKQMSGRESIKDSSSSVEVPWWKELEVGKMGEKGSNFDQ